MTVQLFFSNMGWYRDGSTPGARPVHHVANDRRQVSQLGPFRDSMLPRRAARTFGFT